MFSTQRKNQLMIIEDQVKRAESKVNTEIFQINEYELANLFKL